MRIYHKKKILHYVFLSCFFAFIAFSLIWQSPKISYQLDELSWFFHTEFFDELFLRRNFDKTLWTSFESFDHPQLSKYIFGGYLFSQDFSYTEKREELRNRYGRWEYYDKLTPDDIPKTEFFPYFVQLRQINIFFTWLTLVGLFVLFYQLSKNIVFSSMLVGLLAYNTLFLQSMLRGTSDAHYIFFMIWSLVSYVMYLRTEKKQFLYVFAMLVSLSTSAKLTGILVLFAYILYKSMHLYYGKVRSSLTELAIVLAIFFGIWISINPALYFSPGNTFVYFSTRSYVTNEQQREFPKDALLHPQERAEAVYCVFFSLECNKEEFWLGHVLPNTIANIAAFIVGIVALFFLYREKTKRKIVIFLLVVFVTIVVATASVLPLNWERYFLPLSIIFAFLECLGLQYFFIELLRYIRFDRIKTNNLNA